MIRRRSDPASAARIRQGYTPGGFLNLVVFGDSKSSYGEGYPNYITPLSKGRIRVTTTYSHPGYAASSLLPLVGEVINRNPRPDAVLIDDGTNDAIGSVPRETYLRNMRLIITAFADAGIKPIVLLQPPLGNTGSSNLPGQNNGLAALCRTMGVPAVDCYNALVNPANSIYQTAYDSGDQVHPSPAGIAVIAQAIVTTLTPLLNPGLPAGRPAGTANLVPTGAFMVDTNADGLADNWTLSAGGVASLVTDATVGKWQRVTLTGATAPVTLTSAQVFPPGGSTVIGDTYALSARVRTGQSGVNTAINCTMIFYTSAAGVISQPQLMGAFGLTQQITDGAIYREFVSPALTGIIRVVFTFGKSTSGMDGTYDVAAVSLDNLTANGVR